MALLPRIAAAAHLIPALTFAAFALLLAISNPPRLRIALLALGNAGIVAWAVAFAWLSTRAVTAPSFAPIDLVQVVAWFVLAAVFLDGLRPRALSAIARAMLAALLTAIGWQVVAGSAAAGSAIRAFCIGLDIGSLWLLAETWRRRDERWTQSWNPAALCMAAALLLNGVLWIFPSFGPPRLDFLLIARAVSVAAAAPLLAVLCRRATVLDLRIFVSRQALTTVMFLIGLLLVIGLWAGLVDALLGDETSSAAVMASTVAISVVLLMALLTLGQKHFRAVRVVLSKHFYRFRYDYREEWLKLIDNLASSSIESPLPERSIKALANIIRSRGGVLFVVEQDHPIYLPVASWQTRIRVPLEEFRRDALIAFMEQSEWIVDTTEKDTVTKTGPNFLTRLLGGLDCEVLVVPLLLEARLFGFVMLERPIDLVRLSYEDIDLLRTGGRQVASHLAQHYTVQRLAEAEQFEAFGRMSAFLVHDLSNISAQQSLILQNAPRHEHNVVFFRDAMKTIALSVDRINRLVEIVRIGADRSRPETTNLADVVNDASQRCADYTPRPLVEISDGALKVVAHRERLSHGLSHLIRNAQQATGGKGRVMVKLLRDGDQAVIEVSDDGTGMSDTFVRERLFRPFHTTKQGGAMGIGAYQLREVVRDLGGTVSVQTAEGLGSVFGIRIPLAPE